MWAEPQGRNRKQPIKNRACAHEGPFTEDGNRKTESGLFYTGVRRFIIVATEIGSSVCV